MEEFEILDLQDLAKQHGIDHAMKYLNHKLQKGYKVSVMVKKLFNFTLPTLQSKKNEVFSKNHQPVVINTESSKHTEPMASSTSSYDSVPKATVPVTQNETPDQDVISQSSEEQVSLYHVKDDTFEVALKSNLQNQKIQNALLFYQDGKLREALSKFMEAYNESWEILRSNEDRTLIKTYVLLCIQALLYTSQVLRSMGQPQEAIKYLDKCMQAFEINDFDIMGKFYMEKANCAIMMNQLIQAVDYYNKALLQYEQVNWKLDIARVLMKMSYVYAKLNNFEDAKKMCYEVLNIYQKKLGPNDSRIFETYYTLGLINYYQKDYDFSQEYLNWAMDGYKKLYGEKHIQIVKILNLMGVINHQQGNMQQAVEYYEQAVCQYGDETHIGLASVLNNLALAYLDRMKFKSAKLSFDKAIVILKEFFTDSHYMVKRVAKNRDLVALATLSYL